MKEYHKIDTVFKRDPATKHKSLIMGDYSNDAFEYLKDNEWSFTEKVDGTNIRVMFSDGRVSFGGKTDAASIPAMLVERLRQLFDTPETLEMLAKVFPSGGCLYGEGHGEKIQSGGSYCKGQNFVLFDVLVGDFWLRRGDIERVSADLAIMVTPEIGVGSLSDMVEITRAGFNSRWGDFTAEGIVARPTTELRDRAGRRVITKIKHKDFSVSRKD